jgi:hypothetical protein
MMMKPTAQKFCKIFTLSEEERERERDEGKDRILIRNGILLCLVSSVCQA